MSNEYTEKHETFEKNVEPKRTFIPEPLNEAVIQGTIHEEFKYSHRDRARFFYKACIAVKRTSGTSDYIYVIVDGDMLKKEENAFVPGTAVKIKGRIYSSIQKEGKNNRLRIYIYTREISLCDKGPFACENNNLTIFTGIVGKKPYYKTSPLTQRKITEFVATTFGRKGQKYTIPCVCWKDIAEEVKEWEIGQKFEVQGRLQSRYYWTKNNEYEEVHEISVCKITKI